MYFGNDLETVFFYYPPSPHVRYGKVSYQHAQFRGSVGITTALTVTHLLNGAYHNPIKNVTYFFSDGKFIREDLLHRRARNSIY